MTFLLALLFTIIISVWSWIQAQLQRSVGGPTYARTMRLIAAGGGWLLAIAWVTAMLAFAGLDLPRLTFPALLLAGSGLCLVGYGAVVWSSARSKHYRGYAMAGLVALLTSSYLAFTGLNHLHFFWDASRTGVLASTLALDAGIRCDADYLLIRVTDHAGAVTYRCPHNLFIGSALEEPFVPWPSYDEGTSDRLGVVIANLHHSASR